MKRVQQGHLHQNRQRPRGKRIEVSPRAFTCVPMQMPKLDAAPTGGGRVGEPIEVAHAENAHFGKRKVACKSFGPSYIETCQARLDLL